MSEMHREMLPNYYSGRVARHVICAYIMGALGVNFGQLAHHLEAVEIAAHSVVYKWYVRPDLSTMAAADRAVEFCLEGDFQAIHMWGGMPAPAGGLSVGPADKPAPKEDPTDWRDVCEGFAAPL